MEYSPQLILVSSKKNCTNHTSRKNFVPLRLMAKRARVAEVKREKTSKKRENDKIVDRKVLHVKAWEI